MTLDYRRGETMTNPKAAKKDNHDDMKETLPAINNKDIRGLTPLHIAAMRGFAAIVVTLLEHKAHVHVTDGSSEEDQPPQTTSSGKDQLPQTTSSGKDQPPQTTSRKTDQSLQTGKKRIPKGWTPLLYAAVEGRVDVVRKLIGHDRTVLKDVDKGGNTAFHLAAEHGQNEVLKLLKDDFLVDRKNKDQQTALHLTARKGLEETCTLLLAYFQNLLDEQDKYGMTPLHLAAKDGHIDVVELLLDKGAKILQDKNHLNYFDHAIDNGHTELVKIIINSKYWRSALRSTRRKADGSIDTPMRKLIRQMPKMARLACDKCIEKTTKGETESETHRYEFLDDTYSAEGWAAGFSAYDNNDMLKRDAEPYTNSFFIRKKNHPLNVMLECDRQELFKHPVVKSLMTSKWHGIYRALYMSSLLMYCVFLAALTGFLIAAEHPQSANFTLRAESHCISQDLSSTTLEEIAAYVVMVLSVANLVIEEWQWQVGAVSIFFGWINLVLYVQQMVPLIGIYVVMFTHTLITFAKFFIVAIIYTLAFGLAFYTVLHQEGSFEDVPKSLIKTWAMMIGELDFSDIFNDDMNKPAFPVLAYILFVVFMIIMSILIMNLLVGLAVGDIQAVQNTAARTRLETEVELILDVEILTPKFLLPKTVSRCKEISYAPTGCRQWFKRCWNRAKPMVVPSSAYVKPPETRDEISIEERLDEMSDMIRSLMKANKIDTTEKKAI